MIGCGIRFLRRGGELDRERHRLPVLIVLCFVQTEEIEPQRVRHDAKLERLIASAPNIGCSVQPKIGIHTPAASGMPMIL